MPDGVDVDMGGFAFMGGHDYRPGSAPIRPGTPIVRVRGYALMGGVDVRVKRTPQPRRAIEHGE